MYLDLVFVWCAAASLLWRKGNIILEVLSTMNINLARGLIVMMVHRILARKRYSFRFTVPCTVSAPSLPL